MRTIQISVENARLIEALVMKVHLSLSSKDIPLEQREALAALGSALVEDSRAETAEAEAAAAAQKQAEEAPAEEVPGEAQ